MPGYCPPPRDPKFKPIPTTWQECKSTFNQLALHLHPDKPSGSGAAFDTITKERDAWYAHFSSDISGPEAKYLKQVTDDIRECYMWLQKNRSVLINYIRAACQFHRMENQENKSLLYEQIFSSKVTFLDGILTWLRDVLGRMAPDGSYRSSLRLNARCAIGLLIQLYLTGIEK